MTFFKIPAPTVEPITSDLAGWTKIGGEPTMTTWIEYSSADGKVIAGWWHATPGIYYAEYAGWEFVHLIEGKAIITPQGGKPVEVGPGDAFVFEADFKGEWEIVEPVKKHFTIRFP